MKVVLIGPGGTSIPPKGWGAVEIVIWDYYQNLIELGDDVVIINETNKHEIIRKTNQENADIVHIMYDDHIDVLDYLSCRHVLYTTHWAYLTNMQKLQSTPGYARFVHILLNNRRKPYIFALSQQIADVYKSYGFPEDKISINHNGARHDLFHYSAEPQFTDRSIYVGKIEDRKKQYMYQNVPGLYFAGNCIDNRFDKTQPNYLGHWDKETLYSTLTEYGNLVLLSDGEADPLVVKEALVSGLGVVVSEVASANLDRTKGFIAIIPDSKLADVEYISNAIKENRMYSTSHREEITTYAKRFYWKNIVAEYRKKLIELIN